MIDAGSGFEAAGVALARTDTCPPRVDLLLSHLHHDHIMGLPFFSPMLSNRQLVRTFCGNLGGESAAAALDVAFAPPLFPITLDKFPGHFEHIGFTAGETLTFENGTSVKTCPLRHPGGATGYRFDHAGRSLCYISDIEHEESGPDPKVVAFCHDADLVIYDAMFTEAELPRCRGWGHSTWEAGVDLCKASGAKALAAFHHHKHHDDAAMAAIETELGRALPGSFAAREGQTIVLEGRRVRAV